MSLSNARIEDALIHALYLHKHQPNKRPLRALVDKDFSKIRTLRSLIQRKWRYCKENAGNEALDYRSFRAEILDEMARKEKWHQTTRNLYASILSILVNWDRDGIANETQKQLQVLRPGAELFLQFLHQHEPNIL